MKLGFIGLGNMGRPMARRLLQAGYELVAYNRSRATVEELAQEGALPARSLEEVAHDCEVVLTALRLPQDSEEVYLSPQGLITHARTGHIFIEHSTIGPTQARRIFQAAKDRGAGFLDAPVSGGVSGAREGTLAIMVGGEAQVFERVRPVLEALGQNLRLVGPSGAGCTVKLVNQLMLAINLAGVVEGMVLARKGGVDQKVAAEVIKHSTGASAAMLTTGARMLNRDFEPTFALNLLLKDLRLAAEMAQEAEVRFFFGNLAKEVVGEACMSGLAGQDIAALVQPLEELAGVRLTEG